MYERVQSERLYQQIVDQIEKLVLSGTLKVGDKLAPERDLAEQFGVSRTAVREAVKALREKGLVEVHPGRGTFITNSTAQVMRDSLGLLVKIGQADIWDMMDVRDILEPEIAARAAVAATQEDVAEIDQWIAQMDAHNMHANKENVEPWLAADLEFHLALARATQNIILLNLFDSITDLRRDYFSPVYYVATNSERAQRQHKLVRDAILARDPEAARHAMAVHLQHVREECGMVERQTSGGAD